MALSDLIPSERRIIGAILDAAAARGLVVSVNDGEEWALKLSRDPAAIREAIGGTCSTVLTFRDPGEVGAYGLPRKVGQVLLIHGNGCDVLADWSNNRTMSDLLAPALAVAESEAA